MGEMTEAAGPMRSGDILFVAPWVPGTLRPRSLGLLGRLSERFRVHVLVVSFEADPDMAPLAALHLESVNVVRASRSRQTVRAALQLWKDRSLQQLYLDVPEVRVQMRRIVAQHRPIGAYFNVLRSAQWVDCLDGSLPKVIDLDEFRSEYYRLTAKKSSSPIRRIIGRIEAKRMARAEDLVMQRFDAVLVSSPCDVRPSGQNRAAVRLVRTMHTPSKAAHISSGHVDLPDASIVFVGRMSYSANAEAAIAFAREVFPLVQLEVPHAKLYIVGADPGSSVVKLATKDVVVTGSVPDVRPYYAAAAVAVVPVKMATGVQMKLIEALAAKAPVVCEVSAASRAGVVDGVHCVVAADPVEWSTRIIKAIRMPLMSRSLAVAGHEWVEAEHSPAAVSAQLDACLDALFGSRSMDSADLGPHADSRMVQK